LSRWEQEWTEPLQEYTQFSSIIKGLLKYRHQKHVQFESSRELLESKRSTLEELERSELEAQRLAKALDRVKIGGSVEGGGGEESNASSGGAGGGEHQPLPPLPPVTNGSVGRKSGLLSALSHSVKGFVDSDPEASRRNTISKTREQINQVRSCPFASLSFYSWEEETDQKSWSIVSLAGRCDQSFDSRFEMGFEHDSGRSRPVPETESWRFERNVFGFLRVSQRMGRKGTLLSLSQSQ